MSDVHDLFVEALKKGGYSSTKSRKIIFDVLIDQEPLSMNELVDKVKKRVDRASVYRTIELFEKLGIAHRLQMGWKYKLELTDTFNYHHHHISCTNCGKVIPVHEDTILESSISTLAKEYGFKATNHQIEIQGLCKDCTSKVG